ncbi:hypothetical protein KJ766_01420 [Patescibacteria group bacterium]|nr:hypothetical protein [Patescibacteria group bacterium]
MQALKELCNQYSKWKPLEDYILRVETYSDNGPLIADNCKCIVESVCKTILEDLRIPKEEHKTKLHELAKQTVERLGCINKSPGLIAAFTNTAQKLAEFRNEYTETGHGQSVYAVDENRKKVTATTIAFLVAIIEQTALYLITVYQDEYPQHIQSQLRYEDSPEFNADFDDQNEVIVIGQYGPYSPSEVLFNIDEIAYKTELKNIKQE